MTRTTLGSPVTLVGTAVRTHGGPAALRLEPGGDGFAFTRDDTGVRYPADLDHLVTVPNATALGAGGRPEVLFVEHVLSALAGLGYTDAEVHLDGPEVPLLDGSALPIAQALQQAGRAPVGGELEPLRPQRPIWYVADGQCLAALPAEHWSVDYSFEHAHPQIAWDRAVFEAGVDYATEIAPARTFATEEEIRALQAAGLVRGGSEDNLLVVYANRYSAPLRLAHEFASHKVLDLLGDLALLGRPLCARLVAYRTGHHDNHALARRLAQES